MINTTGKNVYMTIYILFLIAGAALLYNFKQPTLELTINSWNNIYLDYFFKYITHLGDGLSFVSAVLVIGIFDWKKGVIVALIGVTQGILVQGLKNYAFPDAPRPMHFFQHNTPALPPHLVDGVDIHSFNSFPSGHTATIFAITLSLVFVFTANKPLFSLLLFLVAFVVGYSRIYLMQHFFVDVYMGAIIGVFITIVGWNLASKYWLKEEVE